MTSTYDVHQTCLFQFSNILLHYASTFRKVNVLSVKSLQFRNMYYTVVRSPMFGLQGEWPLAWPGLVCVCQAWSGLAQLAV